MNNLKKKTIILMMIGLALLPILSSCDNKLRNCISYYKDTKTAIGTSQWLSLHVEYQYVFSGKIMPIGSYDVSYYIDGENSKVYYISHDSLEILMVSRDSICGIDLINRNIENYKNGEDNGILLCSRFPGYHVELSYNILLSKYLLMPTIASISNVIDSIVGEIPIRKYIGDGALCMKQNPTTKEFDIPIYTNIYSWINLENYFLDSVVIVQRCEEFPDDKSKKTYRILSTSFEDKSLFFNSIFNFNATCYNGFRKMSDKDISPYYRTESKATSQELLLFRMTKLNSAFTTLNDEESWLLLNFWTFNCPSCIEHLKEYGLEQDSLGYRVLENEGIKICAINYTSDNMELIRKVADKTGTADIMYSAKGMNTFINIPALGYYYLLSPDKEIVYETYDLGDYSELLKAKEDYEKKHAGR